ncbi:MAG: DUF5680 domain-containing protein [Rudaea sp.]
MLPVPVDAFVSFLLGAKRHTYASGETAARATSLLPGSIQLEYALGDLLYRDSYFGGNFFAGQELVYFKTAPIWSMTYAGGLVPGTSTDPGPLYDFLKQALRQVSPARPFRGPGLYRDSGFQYTDSGEGAIERFYGVERIGYERQVVYELRYAGGVLE